MRMIKLYLLNSLSLFSFVCFHSLHVSSAFDSNWMPKPPPQLFSMLNPFSPAVFVSCAFLLTLLMTLNSLFIILFITFYTIRMRYSQFIPIKDKCVYIYSYSSYCYYYFPFSFHFFSLILEIF